MRRSSVREVVVIRRRGGRRRRGVSFMDKVKMAGVLGAVAWFVGSGMGWW